MRKIFIFLFFISLITSCAKKVQVSSLNPPNYPQVMKYKKIAVLPFKGKGADLLALEIESALANVYVNGKPFYQIADRQTIKQVLNEQKFSSSGLVNEKDAVKIGKLLGVQGIYTVSVLKSGISYNQTYEKRVKCLDDKCKKTKEYYVRCKNITAVFSFIPRLIDVETSKVVFAKNYTRQESAKNCVDDSYTISTISLLEEAKRKAINEFLRDVAPYRTVEKIKILDDDSEITSDKDKELFEKALDFADKNFMDKACNLWNKLLEKYPNSVVLNYNNGVCSEYFGNFEKAYYFYKKAYDLMQEPIEEIGTALQRIKIKLKKRKILKSSI